MGNKRFESGFTLVEMMVAVVLFGIISMSMVGMVRFYQNSYSTTRNVSQAYQSANFSFEMMLREIRQAASIDAWSSQSITFTDQAGNNVVYAWNTANRRLLRAENMDAAEILSEGITNFNIAHNANNLYTISLTVNDNGSTVTLRNSVRPRNI